LHTALELFSGLAQRHLRLVPLGNILADAFVGNDSTVRVFQRRIAKLE
jgi:hypothetical protein